MAIDYFGHSTRTPEDAQRLIVHARDVRSEWFDRVLLLYDAKPLTGPFAAEVSGEFCPGARSCFMLSVNDKELFSDIIDDALDFLYRLFGTETLVMTHGMDTVHPAKQAYPAMPLA